LRYRHRLPRPSSSSCSQRQRRHPRGQRRRSLPCHRAPREGGVLFCRRQVATRSRRQFRPDRPSPLFARCPSHHHSRRVRLAAVPGLRRSHNHRPLQLCLWRRQLRPDRPKSLFRRCASRYHSVRLAAVRRLPR
jgi:hypothetical protein